MRFKAFAAIILFVISPYIFCQENSLSIINIPPELLENSNSILRNEAISIVIDDIDKMTIQTTRIVTVLNKSGEDHVSSLQFYNENSKIKEQSAVVYNAFGKEIKKYKQRDFTDVSAVSSNDLYSDSRISYLDYTAISFPYTIVYTSEVVSDNTIFIQPWSPLKRTLQGVQASSYKISNPKNIPLRIKEANLDSSVVNSSTQFNVDYSVKNVASIKAEHLSPSIWDYTPKVRVALQEFELAGVQGSATNWQDFGKWQYDNLLINKNKLSSKTIAEVTALTKDEANTLEKARLIYEYMQAKTRYISIQLGIGGWMPMNAIEVDNLGYGDCKALTNYTYSLLESQGIKSYYTVVYAGEEQEDLDSEFASMQGNHVILTIPQENENIYLECTSQTTPFNYLGDFTDNRNVLLIKPTGGEIVKTKKYNFEENLEQNNTQVILNADGNFEATLVKTSSGIGYGNRYGLERLDLKDQERYYRNSWKHLKNLDLEKLSYLNDKKEQTFQEQLSFSGTNFSSKAGNRLLVPLSIFYIDTEDTPRYANRKYPVEILRGKTVSHHSSFKIPEGFEIESIPKPSEFENQFGSFKFTASVDGDTILVEQNYVLKDGIWPKEDYTLLRDFMRQVQLNTSKKAVLLATN